MGGDIVIKGWPSWADIWSIVKTFVLGCLENSHANDLQNKSLLRVEVYAQPPLQHPTWQLIVNCCRCTYPLHAHFLQRLVESCPILSKTFKNKNFTPALAVFSSACRIVRTDFQREPTYKSASAHSLRLLVARDSSKLWCLVCGATNLSCGSLMHLHGCPFLSAFCYSSELLRHITTTW